MARKLRVGILFGGRSGEHEVSLMSANSIVRAIDRKKFAVTLIGITKRGAWLTGKDAAALLAGNRFASKPKSMLPPPGALGVDVVFPVLHGTFGEDGTLQGLLDIAGIPYVGSGVLGSAVGMDKDASKRLFAAAGLPIVPHLTLLRGEIENSNAVTKRIEKALRYPLFVKPANLGSSVGISKVHDRKELLPALKLAAAHDLKILIEQGASRGSVKARELEVAVLGNDGPQPSIAGEIVPGKEFYDYDDKYINGAAVPLIPAPLTRAQSARVRELAITAFQVCFLSGLARVDFLLDPETGKLYLNEVNTMPGFTSISMYPKLWQATGMSYSALITRLIELAVERAKERADLCYSRE